MDKVTVRIWMPGENQGPLGTVATWLGVGHAALTVRVGDRKHYITWMAHGSPFAGCTLKPYEHIGTFTKADDKENMVQFFEHREPTHKIKLKTRQPGSPDGLDAGRIETFWLERLENKPKYSFLSLNKNCTGCVADALRAGGLEQYVPAPDKWLVLDADDLLAWCLAAERRLGKVG